MSGGTTRDSEGPATGRFGRLMKLASTVDLAVASYGEPWVTLASSARRRSRLLGNSRKTGCGVVGERGCVSFSGAVLRVRFATVTVAW